MNLRVPAGDTGGRLGCNRGAGPEWVVLAPYATPLR
jgi:hypothetical protein